MIPRLTESSSHNDRPWVVRLPGGTDLRKLAELRGSIDVEVLEIRSADTSGDDMGGRPDAAASDGNDVVASTVPGITWLWLRGPNPIPPPLFAVRDAEHFRVLPSGQLVPFGSQLPHGEQPKGNWIQFSDWFRVEVPSAGLEGRAGLAPLKLVRTGIPQKPRLLGCSFSDWNDFVLSSSILRLQPLRFVCCSDGRVLCQGWPLPPIPGEFWHAECGVAVPCGWSWTPPLQPAVVRASLSKFLEPARISSATSISDEGRSQELNLTASPEHVGSAGDTDDRTLDTTFLLYPQGHIELIEADAWCPATYAAVRATEVRL